MKTELLINKPLYETGITNAHSAPPLGIRDSTEESENQEASLDRGSKVIHRLLPGKCVHISGGNRQSIDLPDLPGLLN